MSKKLRIGIIGGGMIAHNHARSYAEIEDAELAAVCDVDESRLDAFARRHNIHDTYTDYEKMVAKADIDAVSVCLPVFLHAPATVAALEAGKHVLCEKPMAMNVEEAQQMVDAGKKAGKKLAVYWRRRFSATARVACDMIARGDLGRVYFAKTVAYRWRGRPGFDMPAFGKWFIHKEQAGGGTLMDIGGYNIDLVVGLLGFPEIKSVSGAMYQEIDKEEAKAAGLDIEEFFVGMIRLADGGAIWLESSFALNLEDPEKTVFAGDQAGLMFGGSPGAGPLTYFKHFPFRGRQSTAIEVPIPKDPKALGWLSAQEHFVDSCLNDKLLPISSGDEALIISKIQEALYKSAEAGKEIPFE